MAPKNVPSKLKSVVLITKTAILYYLPDNVLIAYSFFLFFFISPSYIAFDAAGPF